MISETKPSTLALNKVWEKYGCLPNSYEINYEIQQKVQIDFSHAFFEVALRVYDIREDYRVSFAMTRVIDQDIWRWFWWNEKDLIVPALILNDIPYVWYECWDEECKKEHIPTSQIEALDCYYNKKKYYGHHFNQRKNIKKII